jgi:hypothetical protein
MAPDMNRREFLGSTAAAAAAFTIVPRHVLGGSGFIPPSDKITVAHVGFGTEAIREVGNLLENPSVQLTAVCDVEKDGVNYLEWGKGQVRDAIRRYLDEPTWREGKDWVPGGRDVGKELIEKYYAKKRASESFKGVNTYIDFREMFEKEKDLDGVKVMTPDHMHAVVSLAAMKKGKHVMVHKPLANRVAEGRLIIEAARQSKVVTHFMPSSTGVAHKQVQDWIKEGAIGTLREIHNWSSRPVWPQYTKLPTDKPPIPRDFNWELWLGPVPDRPYHPWYTHTTFRGWYDFGGGALPDMGIYSMWPLFQLYNLDPPYAVETTPGTVCEVVDGNVCAKIQNDYSYPLSSVARMRFAAKGDRAALDLFWYDGGVRPESPEELLADGRELFPEGMLYVGDKGKILAGFGSDGARIIPESKFTEFRTARNITAPPPLQAPIGPGAGARGTGGPGGGRGAARGPMPYQPGRSNDATAWVDAVKGGPKPYGDFLLAGPITEAFNLVAISYRLGGKRLLWDTAGMKITNLPEANKYLAREYRKGWEMGPAV